jgi:hypothetical protein
VKSNHFPRLLYSLPFKSQVNAERPSTPPMLLLVAAALPLVEVDMLVAAALPPVELELLLAVAQPLEELALLLAVAVALEELELLLLALAKLVALELLAACCAHPLSSLSLLLPLLVSEFSPLLGRGSGAGPLLLSWRSSDVLKQFCARGRLSHDGCQPEGGSVCAGSGEDPSGTIAGLSGLQDRRERQQSSCSLVGDSQRSAHGDCAARCDIWSLHILSPTQLRSVSA